VTAQPVAKVTHGANFYHIRSDVGSYLSFVTKAWHLLARHPESPAENMWSDFSPL